MPPLHTHTAIVATGDELAIGQSLNTNSKWLADHLLTLGVETVEHVIVGDDLDRLVATLRRLCAHVPLVIVTGGLGPTLDDVTRQALAAVMNEQLVTDAAALARLERRFTALGRLMTENQRWQALRPPSAAMLANDVGTAPGLHGVVRADVGGVGGAGGAGGTDVFCLPGPPRELWPIFERDVVPRLRLDPSRLVRTRLLHLVGIGEGDAAARLGGLMARTHTPLVGITAAGAVLTIRIRAVAGTDVALAAQLDNTEAQVRSALGTHIFGSGSDTLEGVVVGLLRSRQRTLVAVESCTGGGLGAMITRIPGASDVFAGGWISYSNEFKERIVGVPRDLLDAHGAVSEPAARAMALGGLTAPGATDALAITGIAGPGGGSEAKPVGTVYIAHAQRAAGDASAAPAAEVRRFRFTGDREDVRERSARSALAMLYFALSRTSEGGSPFPPLLWQVPSTPSFSPPAPPPAAPSAQP